jgi:hypothetical protein
MLNKDVFHVSNHSILVVPASSLDDYPEMVQLRYMVTNLLYLSGLVIPRQEEHTHEIGMHFERERKGTGVSLQTKTLFRRHMHFQRVTGRWKVIIAVMNLISKSPMENGEWLVPSRIE